MSYPVTADLTAFLTASSIEYGSVDVEAALAATIDEWEARTGWNPFIPVQAQTYFYDIPCDGILELGRGLKTLTSLTQGTPYSGSGGSAMTINTDFILEPYDGGVDGKPWTRVRFFTSPSGNLHRSIKILGTWGFADTVPDDVQQALLRKAAVRVLQDANASHAGDIDRIKQDTVEISYSTEAGRGLIERFNKDFDQTVFRYKRRLI